MGYSRWNDNNRWPEYVSVAERKKKAEQQINSHAKKGEHLNPVKIEGRKIAKTFGARHGVKILKNIAIMRIGCREAVPMCAMDQSLI